MIKTKKGESDWKNTGNQIRAVWRYFFTLQRQNKLKLYKRRTILHQTRYIIIFDFFYADHSILKLGIATQHNILNCALSENTSYSQLIYSKTFFGNSVLGVFFKGGEYRRVYR